MPQLDISFEFSVPQPPHNKMELFGNRVGGFEGTDVPYVFEVRPYINPNTNYIQGNYKKSWQGGSNDFHGSSQTQGILYTGLKLKN